MRKKNENTPRHGPAGVINSSLPPQNDYITQHSQLPDQARAIGWFQLSFTDIDLSTLPAATHPAIHYCAYPGMPDVNLQSKLAC